MKNSPSTDDKLIIECRIEEGCLGPSGADHVDAFCEFATLALADINTEKMTCYVTPRENPSQQEFQYKLIDKKLSLQQANRYLAALGIEKLELEHRIDDRFLELIEQFMGRK